MATRRQKGTGSIWQDKSTKKWKGQIQIGVLPSGRRKLKTVTGDSQKEVKWKLEAIKKDLLMDNIVDTSQLTIPELAKMVNDTQKSLNQKDTSAHTRTAYSIRNIENSAIGQIPIQKVTERQLNAFYSSLIDKYSDSSIKKIYTQINVAYKKAIKMNIVKANINEDIPCPKSKLKTRKVNALTIEQQKQVVNALIADNKEPYKTMLLLSLFTGMRMGEVGALYLSDIDFENATISIERTLTRGDKDIYIIGENAKTEAGTRTIKVIPYVIDLLSDYVDNFYKKRKDKLLFVCKNKLVTVSQVNCYYKRLITRYKIADSSKGFNQHQLRHTYATRSIESGMSAKVLQKKLGHTDIKVTMNTYADVFSQFEDTEDEKLTKYLQSIDLA